MQVDRRRATRGVTSLLGSLAFVTLGFWALEVDADDDIDVAALADAHLDGLYGFDSVESYEVLGGKRPVAFAVARRWTEREAELLIDVVEPDAYDRWAFLIVHNPGRVDDLHVYAPDWRRVVRQSASRMEYPLRTVSAGGAFAPAMLPVVDVTPLGTGQFDWVREPDEQLDGALLVVVSGRPRSRGLAFDRLELAIDPELGYALRTTYYSGRNALRIVTVAPADLKDFGGRRLPARRRIVTPPREQARELVLRNVVVDPVLPGRLFSHRNLLIQHFPNF